MPKYQVDYAGKKYEIEAPDAETAFKAFSDSMGLAPADNPDAAVPPPAAPQRTWDQNLMGSMAAGLAGGVNLGLPFVGPLAQSATDWIGGGVSALMGGNAEQYVKEQEAKRAQLAKDYPVAFYGTGLAAGLGTTAALANKLPAVAEMMGMPFAGTKPVPVGTQIVNSALSTEALGMMDGMVRGQSPKDAALETAPWAIAAGAIPGVGATIGAVGKSAKKVFYDPVKTFVAPENVARSTVTNAIRKDQALGNVMSDADVRIADEAGIPLFNADRFGENTRRLARTATNIEPGAADTLKKALSDRFVGQTSRATDFVTKLVAGKVDDVGFQDQLRRLASDVNDKAYEPVYSSAPAQALWNDTLAQFMQSDAFQAAVMGAEKSASNRAAVDGVQAVRNPFVLDASGAFRLRTNPDGSTALPNLRFWNQVKRNLDGMIDSAKPTATQKGDRNLYADLTVLKQKFVDTLDAAVPGYKEARSGAALFFGTDNAVDAGRIGARTAGKLPEFTKAIGKMNQYEREAAEIGYASELLDQIGKSGDNRNLFTNSLFNSPDGRKRNELFLGAEKAAKLEAYVRVESIVDHLRGAVTGNSSTAQQLLAMGAFSAGGFALGGGINNPSAWLAAAAPVALRYMGKKGNEKVLQSIAQLLSSQDPKDLDKLIRNAALSPAYMEQLRALEMAMSVGAKTAVIGAATNQP